MTKRTQKRLITRIIDYAIIVVYAIVLSLATTLFLPATDLPTSENPYPGQLIGFTTFVLPVIAYYFICLFFFNSLKTK